MSQAPRMCKVNRQLEAAMDHGRRWGTSGESSRRLVTCATKHLEVTWSAVLTVCLQPAGVPPSTPSHVLNQTQRRAFGQTYPIPRAPPTSRRVFLDHTEFFHAGKIARVEPGEKAIHCSIESLSG